MKEADCVAAIVIFVGPLALLDRVAVVPYGLVATSDNPATVAHSATAGAERIGAYIHDVVLVG